MERAKLVMTNWPEWKKNIQLTKYKSSEQNDNKQTHQKCQAQYV